MGNFILRVYIKWKLFVKRVINFIRLMNFSYYLYKRDIFLKGDPKLVLRVLEHFTYWAFREYDNTKVMNRSTEESVALFSVLIDSYFETGSSTTLSQILEVLKNEFIEREKNGRK